MVSTEEILITLLARDNASPVFEQVAGNASTQLSGMSSSIGSSFGSLGSSATGTFDNIRESVGALNTGMMGLSSASNMLFQELGAKKSASDYVYGTSAKEDTNKVLLSRMRDSEEQGESMLNTIDTATDNALVSMQDLIPALNVIQSSTGATGQEIENVSNQVAQFGSFVLAQTGSVELASTAMDGLAKGIKGAFDIIDDYTTKDCAMCNYIVLITFVLNWKYINTKVKSGDHWKCKSNLFCCDFRLDILEYIKWKTAYVAIIYNF